jgi:hypothetical protein
MRIAGVRAITDPESDTEGTHAYDYKVNRYVQVYGINNTSEHDFRYFNT